MDYVYEKRWDKHSADLMDSDKSCNKSGVPHLRIFYFFILLHCPGWRLHCCALDFVCVKKKKMQSKQKLSKKKSKYPSEVQKRI